MRSESETPDHAQTAKTAKTSLLAAKANIELLPRGRETALVVTKIDEALLWLSQVDRGFGPANEALRG
jgi:hypothetical protein